MIENLVKANNMMLTAIGLEAETDTTGEATGDEVGESEDVNMESARGDLSSLAAHK